MIIHELREQYTIYPTHKNRNTIIPGPKPPTPHTLHGRAVNVTGPRNLPYPSILRVPK